MFQVHMTLPVLLDDDTLQTFEREFKLPFAPFPGLQVERTTMTDVMPKVEEVLWDEEKNAFFVVCAEERMAGDRERVVGLLDTDGWKLQEATPAGNCA